MVGESHCTVYFDLNSKTVPSRIETTCESVLYVGHKSIYAASGTHINIKLYTGI